MTSTVFGSETMTGARRVTFCHGRVGNGRDQPVLGGNAKTALPAANPIVVPYSMEGATDYALWHRGSRRPTRDLRVRKPIISDWVLPAI